MPLLDRLWLVLGIDGALLIDLLVRHWILHQPA
jgi:hypothetical protein